MSFPNLLNSTVYTTCSLSSPIPNSTPTFSISNGSKAWGALNRVKQIILNNDEVSFAIRNGLNTTDPTTMSKTGFIVVLCLAIFFIAIVGVLTCYEKKMLCFTNSCTRKTGENLQKLMNCCRKTPDDTLPETQQQTHT